jgi:hypothetical protein
VARATKRSQKNLRRRQHRSNSEVDSSDDAEEDRQAATSDEDINMNGMDNDSDGEDPGRNPQV